MKTKFFTFFVALLVSSLAYAQPILIKNDGATIHVQNGATLYVEGGIENTATGIITNEGTIELKGNLLNNGTLDDTNGQLVKFSGDQNATMTTNGDFINNLEIAKTGGATVSLLDSLSVVSSLLFSADNNRVVLGTNNMTLQSGATLSGHDASHFVVTDDTGGLTRAGISGAGNAFPVGHAAGTYNPATLDIAAGSGDYKARVYGTPTDGTGEGGTALVNVVDAGWNITDGGAGNNVDVTLQWAGSQELGTFSNASAGVGKNDGSGWDLLHADLQDVSAGGDPYFITRSGVSSFSNFAVGGKELAKNLLVDLKVFLQGPYVSGLMNDNIRANINDILPTTEPYTSLAPFTHSAFGGNENSSTAEFDNPLDADDIVDWVFVELRDGTTPSTVLGTKTGLVQRDGDIVDVDGESPLGIPGFADGSYHIAVKHRNHLAIRTPSALALNSTTATPHDFTTALSQAFDKVSVTSNDAMVDLGGGVYGMIRANVNGDAGINIVDAVLAKNASVPIKTNVYLGADINMDSGVNIVDAVLTKNASVPIKAAHID